MKTKNGNVLLLTGIVIVGLITGFLYYHFKSKHLAENFFKGGGFRRSQTAWTLSLSKSYDLPKGYYGVVAYDQGDVLYRDYSKKEVISFNKDYSKSVLPLPIPGTIPIANIFRITQNTVDPSFFDIQCSNNGELFSVDLRNGRTAATFRFGRYFEKAVRLTDCTFACMIQGDQPNFMRPVIYSFEHGKDSITKKSPLCLIAMSEDGMFVRHRDEFIYLNSYNHNFYVLDSNLERKYQGKTIDTIAIVPRTISLRNNTITKFIKQPQIVNQFCIVVGDTLIVNSKVRADNDDPEVFWKSIVLDMYDLKHGGRYTGTIYTDKYKGEELQDVYLQSGKLLLMYPDKLLVYDVAL
ncbi:MAG: hypothetical protein JST42_21850 [Bacteroidetes bacterium]|nr:hypothetical protein [Bacteroidota bacterium]